MRKLTRKDYMQLLGRFSRNPELTGIMSHYITTRNNHKHSIKCWIKHHNWLVKKGSLIRFFTFSSESIGKSLQP